MSSTSISVLGCGWLGFPLAKHFVQAGYDVKGSKTSKDKLDELKKAGIKPFEIRLEPEVVPDDNNEFFNSETLIINIPPPKVDEKVNYHLNQMRSVLEFAKKGEIKNILLVSSTSVYQNCNCEVTEDIEVEPETANGMALREVEKLLSKQSDFNSTIVRFCGLIGPDRNPVKYIAQKRSVSNGNSPVNLIHLDDCINIIDEIINKSAWNEIFNACSDKHPSRKEYYSRAAEKERLKLPQFADAEEPSYKIVSSEKIKQKFEYPDPLRFP
jgi:nucleoside-diphosphate-sugar epimerase